MPWNIRLFQHITTELQYSLFLKNVTCEYIILCIYIYVQCTYQWCFFEHLLNAKLTFCCLVYILQSNSIRYQTCYTIRTQASVTINSSNSYSIKYVRKLWTNRNLYQNSKALEVKENTKEERKNTITKPTPCFGSTNTHTHISVVDHVSTYTFI